MNLLLGSSPHRYKYPGLPSDREKEFGAPREGNKRRIEEAASFDMDQFQDVLLWARSLTGLDQFQIDPYAVKSGMTVPKMVVGTKLTLYHVFVECGSFHGEANYQHRIRVKQKFPLEKETANWGTTGLTSSTGSSFDNGMKKEL